MAFSFSLFCAVVNCFPTQSPVKVSDFSETHTELSYVPKSQSSPVVFTTLGGLEGFAMKTIKGRSIAAFQGIPYALPPVGHLRFKKPQPMRPWQGIRKATKQGHECLQLDIFQYFLTHGQEDCLYLSIYTPWIPSSTRYTNDEKLLPVIFYIHGGGNLSGSGSDYGPSYLLDRDVLLVTINYRLGVLGFLSTGDDASPGNNALKDQLLALEFIAENIRYFGGDRNRISVMGQSSSSGAVGLLMISPRSSHLIHGGIFHSGSPLCHWALLNRTIPNSFTMAETFGCPSDPSRSHEMVNCLREQNAYLLVSRQIMFWKILAISRLPFGPIVESPSDESFLEESPEVSYKLKKVKNIPLLAGVVENEGTIFAAQMYLLPGLLQQINRKWLELYPFVFVYDNRTSNPNQVSSEISNFYFENKPWNFHNIRNLSDVLGDRSIVQGTYYGIQHHSTVAPTYAFHFNFQGKYSFIKTLGLRISDWGIGHLDDMIYLFNSSSLYEPVRVEDEAETAISDFMTNVWSNFAATGKPYYSDGNNLVEIWEPVRNPYNVRVLEISKTPRMVPFPFTNRVNFWSRLQLRDIFPIT